MKIETQSRLRDLGAIKFNEACLGRNQRHERNEAKLRESVNG